MVTCDLTARGVAFVGIGFRVISASQHHQTDVDGNPSTRLTYECEVVMPDGTIVIDDDWKKINDVADITKSPWDDANAKLEARLDVLGAINKVIS